VDDWRGGTGGVPESEGGLWITLMLSQLVHQHREQAAGILRSIVCQQSGGLSPTTRRSRFRRSAILMAACSTGMIEIEGIPKSDSRFAEDSAKGNGNPTRVERIRRSRWTEGYQSP
jgi:hypothetical protein